jgi:hypothetical protein
MKPTEHDTKTPIAATGFFATLCAPLHAKGIGALKIIQGTGAPSINPTNESCAARVKRPLAPAFILVLAALACALVAVIPASAGAYATIGPAPTAGSPGLPDGRVYEQVSPSDKDGNQAGQPDAGTQYSPFMLAEAGGDGVVYSTSAGSIGETKSGAQFYDVAKRTAGGWVSDGAQPRAISGRQASLNVTPKEIGFSADLTQVLFATSEPEDTYLPEAPNDSPFLYDIPDGSVAWVDPPPASIEPAGEHGAEAAVAGFSPDMSTIYYQTQTGFYEFHDGVESAAGVLPDGSVEPWAEPAGLPVLSVYPQRLEKGITGSHGSELRNQVSEDGADAFFLSPSPGRVIQACESAGGATSECEQEPFVHCEVALHNPSKCAPPQLYVRETVPDGTQSTVLVSEDSLLPDVDGLPAPASDGVLRIEFPEENSEGEALSAAAFGGPVETPGYLYASPDGSRAFFESTDALTSAAGEAEAHGLPAGDAKEYMFDTQTGALTYLPGVADAPEVEIRKRLYGPSPILVSSQDGSRFIFNGPGGLSLWSEEGSEGGTVTPIEPLAVGGEAKAAADGSVFVFESAAPLPGFNNGGSHCGGFHDQECGLANQEIYRYDVAENSLTCVSCPPKGVVPSGNADLTHDFYNKTTVSSNPLNSSRGISEDGSRVFFDTPDPLVAQDVNTAPLTISAFGLPFEHGRDVYEWENGKLFLISSGTSDEDSYVGDNSASGNDVFFSTAQGLVPGDTDEGYDVYDARVPRPGDQPPPAPAECEGEVCQGPPNVPVLLGEPASATFSGLGNPPPEATPTPAAKPKPGSKAKGCKKGFVRKKDRCVKKAKAKRANTKRGARR